MARCRVEFLATGNDQHGDSATTPLDRAPTMPGIGRGDAHAPGRYGLRLGSQTLTIAVPFWLKKGSGTDMCPAMW